MELQHNLPGMNTNRIYGKNRSALAKSLEKLASGYAVNRSADDSAGLAVSEKMRSQIHGMKQAVRNCADGISLIQTFEGALDQTVTIIKRMKTLAVQSANGSYCNEVDRSAIQIEFRQLGDELDQIADTDFNGIVMLNGRCMADDFTFLTEQGTMWLTPSEAELPEDSFVSTFRDVPGFPEIEMSIELLPDAKAKLTDDMELMKNLEKLSGASVRSFYNKGIPEFSLEGLEPADMGKFSIVTEGSTAVISTYTAAGGKIDVARVSCTELPHYASSTALGKWVYSSVATGSYTQPERSAENSAFDVDKFKESYVDGKSASRAERQAYLDWINDTPRSTAALVPEDASTYDKDTDPLKFVWSLDGQEYENAVGSSGVPVSSGQNAGAKVPVYGPGYTGGPQIYVDRLRFYYNDEDMKSGAQLSLGVGTDYNYATGYYGGRQATGGAPYMTTERYLNIWLDNGNASVTLTYDKESDTWSDNFGESGSWSKYGLSAAYYSKSDYNIRYGYEARNLYHFYEEDGSLPDGFTLNISVTTPKYRTMSSGGYHWSASTAHSQAQTDDFAMNEYDPAKPHLGGIDYAVAEHGAVYTYDGLTQPDGTVGVWRDKEGNPVDLNEKGVYLPASPNATQLSWLHDGVSITVNNPTMVGEDYIQAEIRLFDKDRSVNAFRRVYDNLTYADSLVLQAGARSKDSIEFTFSYSAGGIGELEADLNCTARGLGIDTLDLMTQECANLAVDKLDAALAKVSMIRSSFGAAQNRLEHKIDNLNNTAENLTQAESRIRDADMAKEMAEFTKNRILTQAGEAMLVQANSLPQQAVSLLGAGD